jgi:ADP-heptose:LPS heptosyltransferase
MSTPIFDDIAAIYPEIQIDVITEKEELRGYHLDDMVLRTVKFERLEFNYDEPLPILKNHERKKPWQ